MARILRIPGSPAFPTWRDLSEIRKDDARAALNAFQALVHTDMATVYTAAGSHGTRWNVWLEASRSRQTLAEWARDWLAGQNPENSGGAA